MEMSSRDSGMWQLLDFMKTAVVVRGLYNGRRVRLLRPYTLNGRVVKGGTVGKVVDLRISAVAPLVVQFGDIVFNPDAKDIEFLR